jgi:Leucine-rich repeat (LRR) protein
LLGAVALFAALEASRGIKSLSLARNSQLYVTWELLGRYLAVAPSLTQLNVRGCDMGDSMAARLARSVALTSSLTHLDLSENRLTAFPPQLLKGLASLQQLVLAGNQIQLSSLREVLPDLQLSPSLVHLDLRAASLADAQAGQLFDQLLALNLSLQSVLVDDASLDTRVRQLLQRNSILSSAAVGKPLAPDTVLRLSNNTTAVCCGLSPDNVEGVLRNVKVRPNRSFARLKSSLHEQLSPSHSALLLARCSLRSWPTSIPDLPSLTALDLSRNQLLAVPQPILWLQLRMLDLSHNKVCTGTLYFAL